MNLLLSLGALTALMGLMTLVGGLIAKATRCTLPWPVLLLLSVGPLSLVPFLACAWGVSPLPRPSTVEALGAHWLWTLTLWGLGPLGLVWKRHELPSGVRSVLARFRDSAPVEKGLFVALAAAGGSAFLWTLLPPFRADELLYHLALPLQYLLQGHFVQSSGDIYGGYPALTEMMNLWLLGAGAESGARAFQLLMFGVGVWAVLTLFPSSSRAAILLGTVFLVVTPVVYLELTAAYVDMVQTVFEFAAVLAFVKYQSRGEPQWLWSSVWLAGTAGGTKYLGMALLPFLFCALLVCLWKKGKGERPPLFKLLLWLSPALIFVLPWLVRNALLFKNPLFPFATHFLGTGGLSDSQQLALAKFLGAFGPKDDEGMPLSGFKALLRLPSALFFQARFDSTNFDGVLGFVPIVLLGASLLQRLERRALNAAPLPVLLSSFAVYKGAIFLSSSWQMRFFIGALWVGYIAGARVLLETRRAALRLGAGVALLLCVVHQLGVLKNVLPGLDHRMLMTGEARHALRLERNPTSRLCDLANTEGSGKLLLVWTHQLSYFCALLQVAPAVDEGAVLTQMLERPPRGELAPERVMDRLTAMGISDILIDEHDWFLVPPGVEDSERQALERTFEDYRRLKASGLTALGEEGSRVLYRVRASP